MEVRRISDALKVRATHQADDIAHDDTRRQLSFAEWDRETGVFRKEVHFDFAETDFTGERMGSTKSALGRISKREKKSLVAPGKILQPQVACRRKAERLTRKIANFHTGIIRGG